MQIKAIQLNATAELPERAHPDDERALAMRARTDRAAFGTLYDRYLDSVFGYCLRRLGDRNDAEDATAIAFTKALAAISSFRADASSFRAWLFAIAHNVVMDRLRQRQAVSKVVRSLGTERASMGHDPEAIAIAGATLNRLRELLAELPAGEARVVELRLAGLTDREIAHVLGRSHGAVRIAQFRAIRRLRALMNGGEETDR